MINVSDEELKRIKEMSNSELAEKLITGWSKNYKLYEIALIEYLGRNRREK